MRDKEDDYLSTQVSLFPKQTKTKRIQSENWFRIPVNMYNIQ